MSSGLSMTSVNKIKELAEAKEYSLAVEILDSQNLEKSLNPQFLRVCGEVYENVGRSKDARNMYVKAHIMGPDSNRILFSLISMYLKRGYFGLAEQYAEQYKYHVRNSEQETKNIEYVLKKAEHTELSLLQGYLHPYYSHNMDEEWSFELFLLQTIQGMDTEMLAADYRATFRRSVRSEQIQEVLDGSLSAEELFWIYADAEHQDRDPEEEEIRELEREQLKKDYLRMHPSAAAQGEEEDEDEFDEDDSAEIVDTPNTEQKFKSFLKRTFRKKSKEDGDDGEGEADENGEKAANDADDADDAKEVKEQGPEGEASGGEKADPSDGEGVEKAPDTSDKKDAETGDAGQAERVKGFVSQFTDRGRNKNEMQEITPDPLDDVITYDFDDGFAAESDTISEMEDYEKESYQNPFDLINAYKITEKEKDDVRKTYGQVPKELKDTIDERKRAAEEEAERKAEAEALAEEEPEPIMEEEPEPIGEEEPEPIVEEEPEPIVEEEPEPIMEEEPEPIVEEEPGEEPEEEPEDEEIPWSEPEPIVEEEPEPIVEEEPEPIVEEEPEPIVEEEPEPIVEEEPEPIVEEEPEPIVEEEPEEEPEEEEIPWSEPEPEVEEEPEPIVEEEPEPIVEEEPEEEAPKKPAKTAFDIMMEKESEKLDEGLAEEERLQREAEALLASLGIKL